MKVDRRRWFTLERPILHSAPATPTNPVFTMGSSGFFFRHKNFDKLVQAMRAEFEDGAIRIHCPIAEFQRAEHEPLLESHLKLYREILAGSRLSLHVSTHFLSEPELLAFLQSNDANALFYDRMEGSGVSSALDLLISARRPIVLTDSDQFRHVKGKLPFYPDASIRQIVALGTAPVEELYRQGQDFLASNERALEEIFALI